MRDAEEHSLARHYSMLLLSLSHSLTHILSCTIPPKHVNTHSHMPFLFLSPTQSTVNCPYCSYEPSLTHTPSLARTNNNSTIHNNPLIISLSRPRKYTHSTILYLSHTRVHYLSHTQITTHIHEKALTDKLSTINELSLHQIHTHQVIRVLSDPTNALRTQGHPTLNIHTVLSTLITQTEHSTVMTQEEQSTVTWQLLCYLQKEHVS
jgi:uncharacterized Zn-finger protein